MSNVPASPDPRLAGQVALITGAGSGIGAAIARNLANQGMRLVLAGRTLARLEALAGELRKTCPTEHVLMIPTDVRLPSEVDALVQAALTAYGRIDVLINNAGVAGKIALLQEIPPDEVHRILDTNLKGAIFVMQAVLREAMIPRQSGTIININSIAGKTAFPYWSVYDASKFALRAVTEAVAEEQRQNNIKVVGIYPGAVDTPIWEGLGTDPAHPPDKAGMLDAKTIADAVAYILEQPPKAFIPEITLTPFKPVL